MKKKAPSPFALLPLLLAMGVFLSSCSGLKEKKKFEVDQEIIDGTGEVTFARAHYIEARTKTMNRVLEKRIMAHLRRYCEEKKRTFKMLRDYHTQTDFITLKYDFRLNRKVHVFEFQCL